MSLVAVVVLWLAVAITVAVARRGQDRSILAATTFVAVSMTTNLDGVYRVLDGLLGGNNLVELGGDLCLVFGTYFLARGTIRAVAPRLPGWELVGLIAAVSVAVGCTVLFAFISAPRSTTLFMLTYGDQWPAAAYSILQITYLGVALGIAATGCVRHRSELPSRAARICIGIVVTGAGVAVVLTASVWVMDLAHPLGDELVMHAGQAVYVVANPLSILLLAGGLAALRVCGWRAQQVFDRRVTSMITTLEPLHERVHPVHAVGVPVSAPGRLHRMVVEIRDGSLPGQPIHGTLSSHDELALTRAARLLGVAE